MTILRTFIACLSLASAVILAVVGVCVWCRQYKVIPGHRLIRQFCRLPWYAQLLLLLFAGRLIVYASTKPDSELTNSPPLMAAAAPDSSTRLDFTEKWFRRGCWDDWAIVDFEDGWRFPYGTGYLFSAVVMSQGSVRSSVKNTNDIASLMTKVAQAPFDTEFSYTHTSSNSYRFVWDHAYIDRNTNTPITASIELFRNGDCLVVTNGVARYVPRVIPFPHDGIGQDDDWVRANFTNASDILLSGYREWVDGEVGYDLENGVYELIATFPVAPVEAVRLVVGDYSVAVTNAGEYVFLLDKGMEYSISTVPFCDAVEYSMRDDLEMCPVMAALSSGCAYWTSDGGYRRIIAPALDVSGMCFWMPVFSGAPDITHVGLSEDTYFYANFSDFKYAEDVVYHWSSEDDNVVICTPDAISTEVRFGEFPSWASSTMKVTASLGTNVFESVLHFTYGENETPQVDLSLDAPDAILLNSNNVDRAKLRPMTLSFSSDLEPNGEILLSCERGEEKIRLWDSAAQIYEISLPFSCDASSFNDMTFWVEGVEASASLNDVCFRAEYVSYDADGGSAEDSLTVIEVGDVILPGAPEDGLVVLRGTSVAFEVECKPTAAASLLSALYNVRRLRANGTYTDWEYAAVNYDGVTAIYTPTSGIYQVQSFVGLEEEYIEDRYYVWSSDENSEVGFKQAGELKGFGVTEHLWQKALRDCACSYLGSTAYLTMSSLPGQYGFPSYPAGDFVYKCNIFVAHRIVESGLICPKTRGWVKSYPPLANDWADGAYDIGYWGIADNEYLEPGLVFADADLEEGHSGHMGIIDFDGCGISAGETAVNRKFDEISNGIILREIKE